MMKRMIALLLAAALALSAAGCSQGKKTEGSLTQALETVEEAYAEETTEAGERIIAETEPAVDYETQLACIVDYKTMWYQSDLRLDGDMWYAVTDLDRNGRLELLRAHQLGMALGESVCGYEVSEDAKRLVPLTWDPGDSGLIYPNIVQSWLAGFVEDGVVHYVVEESAGGIFGHTLSRAALSVQDGTLRIQRLDQCYTSTNAVNGITREYYDEDFQPVDYDTYCWIVGDRFLDQEYVEIYPGWYNLRPGDNPMEFVTWSWAHYQTPWEYELTYPQSDPPDMMVYFDVPGSDYQKLGSQVLELSNGFEDFANQHIRFVANKPNLKVSMEVLCHMPLSQWENAYCPAYKVLDFTPCVGKVYELPVLMTENVPMTRLVISDGVFSDHLDLCDQMEDGHPIQIQQTGMMCMERQRIYPYEDSAIVRLAQVLAGWSMEAGSVSELAPQYWDVVANAITLNTQSGETGNLTVPLWFAESYAQAMFEGLQEDYVQAQAVSERGAVRYRADSRDICLVAPSLRINDRNTRVEQITEPANLGYDPSLGELVVEVLVLGSYESTVLVFLNSTEYNPFGWYISNVLVAKG